MPMHACACVCFLSRLLVQASHLASEERAASWPGGFGPLPWLTGTAGPRARLCSAVWLHRGTRGPGQAGDTPTLAGLW